MAVICPSITSANTHQYREQMERVAPFAKRIHIDFMDGKFAPSKSPGLLQAWWPEKVKVDLHVMYEHPDKDIDEIISLKPHLVVVHAESGGNFVIIARKLHESGIKAGVALLPQSSIDVIKPAVEHVDHVLIFSGDLGYFGGRADLSLVKKVEACKKLKPELEIGWDGGINDTNIKQLVGAGVDVLNVGGYIQRAEKPKERYEILESLLH